MLWHCALTPLHLLERSRYKVHVPPTLAQLHVYLRLHLHSHLTSPNTHITATTNESARKQAEHLPGDYHSHQDPFRHLTASTAATTTWDQKDS